MVKFALWSDIHVEHNKYQNYEKIADTLVIAGDTSNSAKKTVTHLKQAAQIFDRVIFVPGNHDYYDNGSFVDEHGQIFDQKSVAQVNLELRLEIDKLGNMIMLEASPERNHYCFELEDTLFIGDMGWYDWNYPGYTRKDQIDFWFKQLNDSNFIKFDELLPPDLARVAVNNFIKLVEVYQDDDIIKNIVVVTHTVPHIKGLVGPSHPWAHLNGSYYNSMMKEVWEADINKKIKIWCFGHTHFMNDFVDGHVRFVSNPRGYRHERNNSIRMPIVLDTNEELYYK